MKISVSVALEQELLQRLEEARGAESRSAWVGAAVEKALGAAGMAGPGPTQPVSQAPASSRPWGHRDGMPLRTGRQVLEGDYEREPFSE